MSRFPNLRFGPMPAMLPVGIGREVRLLGPLTVKWDGGFNRGGFTIPARFVHDGPSVPNRLRGVVYYTHRLLKPSIAHDYLYAVRFVDWPRALCDRLFLEGLPVEGVGRLRRNTMWSAVRVGGWHSWTK